MRLHPARAFIIWPADRASAISFAAWSLHDVDRFRYRPRPCSGRPERAAAHRNRAVAAKPSPLRTAWAESHCSISPRLAALAASGAAAIRALLIDAMIM